MERRRFRPSAEGLEGRSLLSGLTNIFSPTSTNPSTFVPNTVALKNQRINNTPYFLEQIQPGRSLPTAIMGRIQEDLRPLIGVLSTPSNPVLVQFNNAIRTTLPNASLSAQDAKTLNNDFGIAMLDTGANATDVADLQAAMNQLAQVDANSSNPTRLATDDYSTILQVAIGVGQPIPTPGVPRLAEVDRLNGGTHRTTNLEPRFVGTYQPSTATSTTPIELIDVQNGVVLGSTTVTTAGQYTVQPAVPLTPGTYVLAIRANESGVLSPLSPTTTIFIVAKPTTTK